MAQYIIDIPDGVPVSDECVPLDMCRPSWYLEAYEKGKAEAEDEVWALVRKIVGEMMCSEKRDCFGDDHVTSIIGAYSYKEIKEKYESWKAKRDQIHVGDEVKCGDSTGIVYMVTEERIYGICNDTRFFVPFEWYIQSSHKTGRHFDIEKLLEEIRGG